jgi:hypothetical protein
MPQVGFEPTIPAFKWAKTVHALDHAATVISSELTGNYTSYREFVGRLRRGISLHSYLHRTTQKQNKKFWEELIAYFSFTVISASAMINRKIH